MSSRWMAIRLSAAFSVIAFALTVTGCGDAKTKVKGKVTLNGKPLVWGTITLVDTKGQFYQTTIGLDGTYTMEDLVPAGPVKIGVISPKPVDRGPTPTAGGGKAGGGKDSASTMADPREKFFKDQGITPDKAPNRPLPPAGAWFAIPDKYNDPNNSGLSDILKPGQDLNVDLK